MIINKLTIQGFKSFCTKQTIDFSQLSTPGYFFITGENQVEPRLGANGVGKSTIGEALTWVLFGKTSTNLKAGSVGNWKEGIDCEVVLNFSVHDTEYELIRAWNPNSLKLKEGESSRLIVQEDIEQLIGLDFYGFLYSVFISQFSAKFFDLSPSDKLQVFTELLKLDKWLEYSAEAKKQTMELDREFINVEKDLANVDGQIEQLESQDYSEQSDHWIEELRRRIKYATDGINSIRIKIDNCDDVVGKIQQEIAIYEEKENKHKGKIEDLEKDMVLVTAELSEYKLSVKGSQTERNIVISDLKQLDDMVDGKCPTCKQSVTTDHIQFHITALEEKLASLTRQVTKHERLAKRRQVELLELGSAINNEEVDLRETGISIRKFEQQISKYKVDKGWMEKKRNELSEQLKLMKEETNPYSELMKRNEEKLRLLNKDHDKYVAELNELSIDREVSRYWEKGFREIRLLVVEEVLREFELHVNNSLQKLGLDDWSIKLAVDSETKSGTVRKGFTVLVQSPVNEELVSFECWSGGEGQRLRLAGTLGLMDLIADRSGVDCSLEIWDEPTTWLSTDGIEDVLKALGERAVSRNRQVFLIDHRDLETVGEFDGVVRVVKDDGGSRMEVI